MENKTLLKAIWIAIGTVAVGTACYFLWHRESRIETIQKELYESNLRIASLNSEWEQLEKQQAILHEQADNERKHQADLQSEASQLLGVN